LVGTQLALSAMILGCAASFFYARLIGRDWARRRISGRLARLDRFLAENPFTATLTMRLLPVGNNLALNLLAGLSGVAAVPFLAASAVGYLPQTVVFALLGKGVRVDGVVQIALGAALFAASALLGLLLLRRHRVGRALEAQAG
ncbi:MAG: VTT domain-containing protein, partial [Acetobacteraceae bacterium]